MNEPDELAAVRAALEAEGVDPCDLDRFVNRPFPGAVEPESFDAEAAFPVLLEWLPRLEQPAGREVVARRLAQGARTVGRKRLAAPALVATLRQEGDSPAGWAIADALSRVLVPEVYDDVLDLAADRQLGTSRQMLVYALWRVKDDRARNVVEGALEDEDVCLHAISSLRRMLGRPGARVRVEALASSRNERVATVARRELRKLRRA